MAGGSGSVAPGVTGNGASHQPATAAPALHETVLVGERRLPARTSPPGRAAFRDTVGAGALCVAAQKRRATSPGVTGKGDSGKSSLADEPMGDLDIEGMSRIAVLAVDPTRRRAGGALLGPPPGPIPTASGGQR
ncbi:MAG TPA: hypothetical protein VIL36_13080 [Acidimicrobiales bacterium]